jgi:hypothetical protein
MFKKSNLVYTLSLGAALGLGGCFPTDSGKTSSSTNPVDISTTLHQGDSPQSLPTDIDANANVSDQGIDSMFTTLISRVQGLDNAHSREEVAATDFESLRAGFGAAVVAHSHHPKANIGYAVSAILSLNSNAKIHKMIDSLESYISLMDEYYNEPSEPEQPIVMEKRAAGSMQKSRSLPRSLPHPSGLLSKIYERQGLLPAGKTVLAQAPLLFKAQAIKPNFPSFITMSHAQGIIEEDLIPRLNEVIAATSRLRTLSSMELQFSIDGDEVELDLGDMHIFEAGVRAARAGFAFICIYDMDMHSPDGNRDMRWIDRMINIAENSSSTTTLYCSLSRDTVYQTYYSTSEPAMDYMVDVLQYNYRRSGYLGIRHNYFNGVYEDIKAVPTLIKSGMALIRSETDNQNDDVFIKANILDMDEELLDMRATMLEEGITADLANKFSTPETFMDFISSLLTTPYTFNQTIDGVNVRMKVDLSKFFTNPPSSLTRNWPKHRFPSGADKKQSYLLSHYTDNWYTSSLYLYDFDSLVLTIPQSAILYQTSNNIELKDPITAIVTKDSVTTSTPMIMVDDQGRDIPYDAYSSMFESEEKLQKGFPYFNDYSFGGIFPEMTSRQKWIDWIIELDAL